MESGVKVPGEVEEGRRWGGGRHTVGAHTWAAMVREVHGGGRGDVADEYIKDPGGDEGMEEPRVPGEETNCLEEGEDVVGTTDRAPRGEGETLRDEKLDQILKFMLVCLGEGYIYRLYYSTSK